jgi:hypothetical protein
VGPSAELDTAERLLHHADGAARTFVELFLEEIWTPFDKAGRPQRDWEKLREALERLRPLAAGAMLAAFQIAMAEEVEKESARTLRPPGEEPEQPPVGQRPPLRSVGP